MPRVRDRLEFFCKLLQELSLRPVEKITGMEVVPCGYKTDNTPPAEGWAPLGYLLGAHRHFWIRGNFRTPPAEAGSEYILRINTGITGWDGYNPQGLLYLNGKMVQGLDTNHHEAFLEPDQAYQFHNYFYTGIVEQPIVMTAEIIKRDLETDGLFYDLFVPLEALRVLNENTAEYQDILSAMEQAMNLTDIRQPYSEEYYASIRAAREFLRTEFYEGICTPEGKPVVHCVGHTHIDVEWQWARNQTREKMQRSFSTAASLMKKYPEYRFMLSQPELYRYLREEAPEKYEELKELIAEGRWEPEGAAWVECDCNVTGGESMVRQVLYGKRFFRDQFGKESKILFLPDVFGYSAAMPQILKKSGVDYFITSKISWNDTNTLPVDSFLWQGIDGTEIFTNFITAREANNKHTADRRATYVGKITAPFVMGTWDRYQQKEFSKHTLLTFGFGDGGGGPTRDMLEQQRRLEKGIPGLPVTKIDFLLPYVCSCEEEFLENAKKLGRTPKWVGELYLEYHRGTYTTMARNKLGNRRAEQLLQTVEALSYADMLQGGDYDSTGIARMWRKTLHNQFHDILPGSSIKEVYDGTDRDYAEINAYCEGLRDKKLAALAAGMKTSGGVLVSNTLGFARSGPIQINGKTVELEQAIPAFGWAVVQVPEKENGVTIDGLTAENKWYRMELDPAGRIVSLYDKQAQREVFLPGQCANEFQAYEDRPSTRYDAWDISDHYTSKQYILDEPACITPVVDGMRSGFAIRKKYQNSEIFQTIWLYTENRRIDFCNQINWYDRHQLLKIAFPVDVHTHEATYEIQFGHVTRPTHQNTSWDKARFEVCAHKWADISEHGYGLSLLNDCKYGYSAEDSTLKLTVLKCPTYPNEEADYGFHEFSYALLPHTGDFREGDVVRQAHGFSKPLDACIIGAGEGNLPECWSMVSCDVPNVVIETVKKAEDDDSMIVRLYEAYDSRGNVCVTAAEGFSAVWLCDMQENELSQLEFDGRNVRLPVKNFEIVTLKFKR